MSQIINTNIMSLTAQNNLNKSQGALATAMQRLSSGLRINSSADDAAGFAIAGRMSTQINGLDQAARNANDAVSLAQTASSALQQITSNLQSIRQLAVQSANATNSSTDRQALDASVQQSLAEITRVSQQTTFNGQYILKGGLSDMAFQVGANVGQTISIDLSQGTQASQIGAVATASQDVSSAFGITAAVPGTAGTVAAGTVADPTAAVSFTIDGHTVSVGASAGRTLAQLSTDVNSAITAGGWGYTTAVSGSGLSLTATAVGTDSMTLSGLSGITFGAVTAGTAGTPASSGSSLTLAAGDLSINGTAITGTFANAQALSDGINAAGITGVSSYLDNSGKLVLQSDGTASDGVAADGDSIKVGGSSAVATAFGATAVTASSALTTASGGVNVLTVAGANDTINRIDSALAAVSKIDSQLGAMQNRFNSAISNAQAVSQNLTASRSRIQDADFASETAAMSQSQILQQAGISMLAQANSAPQLVLKLLQ